MNADFFLSCEGESDSLREPRSCWLKGRLRDDERDDYLLVEVAPPVLGQAYGLGSDEITRLILATRHAGDVLPPREGSPVHVYVLRVRDESIVAAGKFKVGQVEPMCWGIAYCDAKGRPH